MIYPMFAMVVLTAVVLVTLFRSRVAAVRQGRIPLAYFGIYQVIGTGIHRKTRPAFRQSF